MILSIRDGLELSRWDCNWYVVNWLIVSGITCESVPHKNAVPAADGQSIGKRLEYLEKSHIAQIFARREEVIILVVFPVCIVYYRLFPYYGDKLHGFSFGDAVTHS